MFAANGRAAHAVFRDIFNPRLGSCPPHRHLIDTSIGRAVAAERYPDDTSRRLACDWIRGLLPVYLDFHDPTKTILAVEQSDEFPLYYRGNNVAQVAARLDRIEVNEGDPNTLITVDLAFGQKDLTLLQIWMNLAVAKHLYAGRGYKRHCLEIHYIDSERVHVTTYSGSDVKGVHLEVGALASAFQEAAEKDKIAATIGEVCMYCPLKADSRCPAQAPVDVEDLGFDDEEDG